MSTTLPYEPPSMARPVVIDRRAGVTRITVAMHGLYAPVPRWVGDLDVIALIAIPAWCLTTLIVRAVLRLPKPPRAVFEVDAGRFKMAIRNRSTGEVTTLDVPCSGVAAARANRFDRGLWLDVPSKIKDTVLTEVSSDTIARIESAA